MRSARRIRILSSALAALAVSAASGVSAAQAGVLVSSATDCDSQSLSQPFFPWVDVASYVLAPSGTLEQGSDGWSLNGGAQVTAGNEPYYVHGAGETSSLRLPSGSTATTAAMCVGIEHPTVRFFARKTAGSFLATLRVDVLFEDAFGNVWALPIGLVGGSSAWMPTAPFAVVANLLPLLPGDHTAVAFSFTPQGGDWGIDDVYVDPYGGR